MYYCTFYQESPQHSSLPGYAPDPELPTIITEACGSDAWFRLDGRRSLINNIEAARERARILNKNLGKSYVAFTLHHGNVADPRPNIITGTSLIAVEPSMNSYMRRKARAGLVRPEEHFYGK